MIRSPQSAREGRRILRPFALALLLSATSAAARERPVVLLQFSDYHSHALPFYAGPAGAQGGIARAIGYLRQQKRRGGLVFSGGDMINKGAPAWSDRYRCAEWPWLNGLVDAMALGNHDADYGLAELARCRQQIRYPLLSANTTGPSMRFEPYRVFVSQGRRIGVFALAGADFQGLVKVPLTFSDPVEAARSVVEQLRSREHVDAVVMIGHQHQEADFALARAVPGIDLIFGSHSHLKRELAQIEGTKTWFLSPWQYLAYISRVELRFHDRELVDVRGGLVAIDEQLPIDRTIAKRVQSMQRTLEHDPAYAPLFATVGNLPEAVTIEALGMGVVETMKEAVQADVALSTASSFRQPLAPGSLTVEALRAALPYDNEIVVAEMSGEQLRRLLDYGNSRKGSDSFAIVSALPPIDPSARYRVATTDYVAKVAESYRDFFRGSAQPSGLHVREEVRRRLATDGRLLR